MVKTALEIAKDTIDILNERGWIQGPQREVDGPMCLGEAIGQVTHQPINPSEADKQYEEMHKLRLTIEAVIWGGKVEPYDDWGAIVSWNDTEGRTKQEVMETLDKAMDVLIPAVS